MDETDRQGRTEAQRGRRQRRSLRRERQTPYQRDHLLATLRKLRQQAGTINETAEEREQKLARRREQARERRQQSAANETAEQREQRLAFPTQYF